jgi:hypothetical protein
MNFSFLSFAAPIVAVVIGGVIVIGLDYWRQRRGRDGS